MTMVPDQIARWIPAHSSSLGTDGYGRSDTRPALRRHFETDTAHIIVTVLKALTDTGDATTEEVTDAITTYNINTEATTPPRLA
jgi:pyruvate dehydrogenase E1 component